MKKTIISASLVISSLLTQVSASEPLKALTLSGDNGGVITGENWDSKMLKGKTTIMMYVDPDKKSDGELVTPVIELFEEDLNLEKFQILMIVNLDATWRPNAIIKALIKSKAKDNPNRTYIVDAKSVLVKEWKLANDEYNVVVIDDSSKIIYSHIGDWQKEELNKLDELVRKQVN